MKLFNLDLALQGHPVCTRDGRKVTEIHYFKTLIKPHVVACVIDNMLMMHLENGKAYSFDIESDSDLFMAPIKIKKWINIYKNENTYRIGCVYDSQEEAIKNKTDRYITTIEIEFDE